MNEIKLQLRPIGERSLMPDEGLELLERAETAEARVAELEAENEAVRDELKQAYRCLESHGDIDSGVVTQGGNQALRHIAQAQAILNGEQEDKEKP